MKPQEKLEALGLKLPSVGVPLGSYVLVNQVGSFLFLSGVLPRQGDQISYQGKLGRDLTVEQGYEAARLCGLNALSILKSFLGSLDRIRKIVRLVGYLQTEANFQNHPQVLNGASDLFFELFGEEGRHARSAVGVASLPLNAACELELTVGV